MKIIYVHGLDSDSNSIKGQQLKQYCQRHYPQINILQPDLNIPPKEVISKLNALIDEETVLVGSSLGGFFSTFIGANTGCRVVLLNPSIEPDKSLQRFAQNEHTNADSILYVTKGGWQIRQSDLDWFAAHRLSSLDFTQHDFAKKIWVIIKSKDELLNPKKSAQFYQSRGAHVEIQEGGDHRMSDFEQQLPLIFQWLMP